MKHTSVNNLLCISVSQFHRMKACMVTLFSVTRRNICYPGLNEQAQVVCNVHMEIILFNYYSYTDDKEHNDSIDVLQ